MAYDVARVRGLHSALGDGWIRFDAQAGMVTPALKAHFQSLGVHLLGLDDGAEAFAVELQGGTDEALELVVGT